MSTIPLTACACLRFIPLVGIDCWGVAGLNGGAGNVSAFHGTEQGDAGEGRKDGAVLVLSVRQTNG